jgi:hypothetical protein
VKPERLSVSQRAMAAATLAARLTAIPGRGGHGSAVDSAAPSPGVTIGWTRRAQSGSTISHIDLVA